MELTGCDVLREATDGCRVIILTATETEAEPVRVALQDSEAHALATKALFVGDLKLEDLGLGRAGEPDRSRPDDQDSPLSVRDEEPKVRAVLAISGCDKTNAAHILTSLLQAIAPPPLVLQVGIAGALPATGLGTGARVGDIVLATRESYSDTGSSTPDGWLSAAELGLPVARVDGSELGGTFPLNAGLVRTAADIVNEVAWSGWETPPNVLCGPCATSSLVTGVDSEAEVVARRWGALAESMEGAAAAHICALHGVSFLEIRGISNLVTDRDRDSWQVERAVAVAARAALAVVARLDSLPLGGD